jgi:hypothetical protein
MSKFSLAPPPSDVGTDLLGMDAFEDSSVASTTTANSEDKLRSGDASAASSALSSAASSSADLAGLRDAEPGEPAAEPEAGFEGGAIAGDGDGEVPDDMHTSNMGFFDRLVRHTQVGTAHAFPHLTQPFLAQAKSSSHTADYKVTFPPGPIGISLEKDVHGRQCLVKAFRNVKNDKGELVDGPAKRSGLIVLGDIVTQIDGEDVLELTFQQTMMRLRQAQESEHTLTFRSIDNVSDLSVFGGDTDLKETKRLIHMQKEKWYGRAKVLSSGPPPYS